MSSIGLRGQTCPQTDTQMAWLLCPSLGVQSVRASTAIHQYNGTLLDFADKHVRKPTQKYRKISSYTTTLKLDWTPRTTLSANRNAPSVNTLCYLRAANRASISRYTRTKWNALDFADKRVRKPNARSDFHSNHRFNGPMFLVANSDVPFSSWKLPFRSRKVICFLAPPQ